MYNVAGVDGAPGGWAIVSMQAGQVEVRHIRHLSDLFDGAGQFSLVAVDMPIGLLDTYQVGGRSCDRAARARLGKRGSSVFPAPVRPVLGAISWELSCARSRASSPNGKAISKQTYGILPKIEEVDELLSARPELRAVIREVHPELCFAELAGAPMTNRKSSVRGRDERRLALRTVFPGLDDIEAAGNREKIKTVDLLDASVACWSAMRIASGQGYSLPTSVLLDATGLEMAIWV
jgi:predicted RNase H-like nuclease